MKIKIKDKLNNKNIKAKIEHKELFILKEGLKCYLKTLKELKSNKSKSKVYIEKINFNLFDCDEYKDIDELIQDTDKFLKTIEKKLNKFIPY